MTCVRRRWQTSVAEMPHCRSRYLRALAPDADGSAMMACRYVAPAPLPPPLSAIVAVTTTNLPDVTVTEALMLKIARFVAHVSGDRGHAGGDV